MSNRVMRREKYDKVHVQFREELKRIRESADLSQEDLAVKLGTKQSFISKVERGERTLDFVEALHFCRACDYDPKKLITKLKL